MRYANRASDFTFLQNKTLRHLKAFERKYEDKRVGTGDTRLGYLSRPFGLA